MSSPGWTTCQELLYEAVQTPGASAVGLTMELVGLDVVGLLEHLGSEVSIGRWWIARAGPATWLHGCWGPNTGCLHLV